MKNEEILYRESIERTLDLLKEYISTLEERIKTLEHEVFVPLHLQSDNKDEKGAWTEVDGEKI